MKKAKWACGLLVVGLAAFAGCGKSDKPSTEPIYGNAQVDLPKLRAAFAGTANAEVQGSLNKIASNLRYGLDYYQVLAELDKLNQNPGTTEAQKKAVIEVIDQVKQLISKAQPSPGK